MQLPIRAALLALLLLVTAASAQGPTVVPDRLETFELPDQHGVTHRVGDDVRVLLLSRDMDGGAIVRAALETKGEEAASFLATRGVVYVADVSGMPGIVRRLFALPRMRSRPYPVLLDTTGDVTRSLPSEEGRATAIWLDELRPVGVEFFASADDLLARIAPDATPELK